MAKWLSNVTFAKEAGGSCGPHKAAAIAASGAAILAMRMFCILL